MFTVITRDEARSRGLTRFFTGQPCRHGHLAERKVCDGKCVPCVNARHSAWERAHPETMAGYKSAPSWIESRAASLKRYGDKPETRAMRAAYYEANRDKILADVARRAADEPEKPRQHKRNYKARKKGAEGMHTTLQIGALLLAQNSRCANPACHKSLDDGYHADHVIALVNGGSNDITNIQLLCPTCNQRKNRKTPEQWAQAIARQSPGY